MLFPTRPTTSILIAFSVFMCAHAQADPGVVVGKRLDSSAQRHSSAIGRGGRVRARPRTTTKATHEALDRLLFDPRAFGVAQATVGTGPSRLSLRSTTDENGDVIPPDWPRSALIAPSFNPAIAKLTTNLRYRMPPGSEYLGAFRHALSPQCEALYTEERKIATRTRSHQTTLIILDKNLDPVSNVLIKGPGWHDTAEDVRIHINQNTILASYLNYTATSSDWHLVELVLDNTAALPSGKSSDPVVFNARHLGPYIDVNNNAYSERGRNFAVFWHDRNVIVQRWLAFSTQSSHVWSCSEKTTLGAQVAAPVITVSDTLPLYGIATLKAPQNMHNSGINLPLYDPISGETVLLAIGHGHATKKQLGALFGTNYFFYFILLRDQAPFKLIAQSPPFCIPSLEDPTKCDLIQFVMSAVKKDAGTVLLAYGVNDCESMVVHVAVDEILRFAREGGVLHFL